MKKELLNKAMMLTRSIINDLWNGHVEVINDYLADDIVAIGPLEGEFYHTKEQAYEMFKYLVDRVVVQEVTNREIYPLVNELHSCVIVGHFVVSVKTPGGKVSFLEQAMTIAWKLSKEKLEICHLHFSVPRHYSQLFDIAAQANRQSFITTQHHGDDEMISIKDDKRRIRIISLSKIEYAMADGHDTIVKTSDETIHARMRWKEFLSLLNDSFLQVHRSYVVKKESVKLIGRNYLEMYSGEQIPVPTKNMREIVNALTKMKS